jgi:hypothetical protein
LCLVGDVSTDRTYTAGRLFSAALIGGSMRCYAGLLLYFLLKMAANVVSALIMSSTTVLKVTSGCGCLRASAKSLAVIMSRSAEESCGIGEL